MYIDEVPNRNSPPAILLRESFRQGGKVKKRTLANLSHWPKQKIEALRAVLRQRTAPTGDRCATEATGSPPRNPSPDESPPSPFRILRSRPHGHVKAVLGTVKKLGLDRLIAPTRSRERDLVVGMIVARLLFPRSKLDTTVRWNKCTLADELEIADADENELYAALDWLLKRKDKIEQKLARRHLSDHSSVLYDLSSSYYTGTHCPLAWFGHNRDDKKRFPIIVYGVLANRQGCPVAVEIYAGNTSDSTTVAEQADKLRHRFGLQRAVLIGDRGSITNTNLETLRKHPALGWIGALRSSAIRSLIDKGKLERSLFDTQNLAEISCDDYPGERLIACFNPLMAQKRLRTRGELLEATEKTLEKLATQIARRKTKPLSAAEIGVRAGKVVNRFKVAKHFDLSIADGQFSWKRNQEGIEREEQLDGIYVVRTSETAHQLPADDAVRAYKSLSQVEQAFRCIKTIDLLVRPIFLRDPDHVKAHILICVLSYYVVWHLRQALAQLLYVDEELAELRQTRDPVAPAEPSPSARRKKATHQNPDGFPVQPFSSLLADLATLSRHTCCLAHDPTSPTFTQETEPTPLQARALELLGL